ncbi:MAG: cardiolipin synthase [Phycisphaerales bacterium]|jgi:cardiolipin synthase|nr:cardiolipin synthase [Phycisphaerales bacterium]
MDTSSWALVLFFGEIALKVVMIAIVILQRKKTSSAKLAWILLIIFIPFIGTLLYLLLGTRRLGSIRRRKHKKITIQIPQCVAAHNPNHCIECAKIEQEYQSISSVAETVGASFVLDGNDAILFGDSDKLIHALADEIDQANDHCHILSYIMLEDDAGKLISTALINATKRGVVCRLLLDDIGSKEFLKSPTCQQLKENGVNVVAALPANMFRAALVRLDLRNHRKIAVIDNSIGFMGSNNIAEPSFAPKPKFAPWVDASIRLTGPIVRELQAIFIQDWYMDCDEDLAEILNEPLAISKGGFPAQLMATGPNSNNHALSQLLQTAFFAAQEELVITTPYFCLDDSTESALLICAKRGISTHLVLPAKNDSMLVAAASRSSFAKLLNAGVHIHEFQGGLLHAKTMTIDRTLALIGSANLDRRSLELNFEVNMLVYDTDFASQLRFLQSSYMEQSMPVLEKTVADWSITRRLCQNAIGLIAPIL